MGQTEQGVVLTGRNTTGPLSRAAPVELRCAAVECYRRRQTPKSKTTLAPYTMYRRASNKQTTRKISSQPGVFELPS